MKKIILFISCAVLSLSSQAQLTQDADGESSLLFRSNHISFDLTKTELAFGMNNIQRATGEPFYPIYGGGVRAKNESGIGNLFNAGAIVPAAEGYTFLGLSFSNGTLPNSNRQYSLIDQQKNQADLDFVASFHQQMPWIVRRLADTSDDTSLRDELLKGFPDKTISMHDFKLKLVPVAGDNPKVKKSKEAILKEAVAMEDRHKKTMKAINTQYKAVAKGVAGTPFFHVMIFGFGGINAMEFKTFSGFHPVSPQKNFQEQSFRGGFAGLGINADYGPLSLGITYRYTETNNFDALTKKTYTLKTQVVYGTQSLIEEKQITAYMGTYGKVKINELKIDFAINVKLDDSATNVAMINPYLRAQVYSRDTALLKNTGDLGCGFYFFRSEGKFLGGFYIELPDVNNSLEKAKPLESQNLRDPLQRLTFGVVTKFSFVSLLNQLDDGGAD